MDKIIIDLTKWQTQANRAANHNGKKVSIQYINKLIRQGKLHSLPLPQIGIVLVEK